MLIIADSTLYDNFSSKQISISVFIRTKERMFKVKRKVFTIQFLTKLCESMSSKSYINMGVGCGHKGYDQCCVTEITETLSSYCGSYALYRIYSNYNTIKICQLYFYIHTLLYHYIK